AGTARRAIMTEQNCKIAEIDRAIVIEIAEAQESRGLDGNVAGLILGFLGVVIEPANVANECSGPTRQIYRPKLRPHRENVVDPVVPDAVSAPVNRHTLAEAGIRTFERRHLACGEASEFVHAVMPHIMQVLPAG